MWYVCNNSKSFYQELEGDECGMFVTIASLSTRNLNAMNVVCL